jgi:hypothetical protein
MEMVSSTIIDFRSFLRRRDLLAGVNDSAGRLNFSRYDPSDLASSDRSWIFSHGFREQYYPCNILPCCYVIDNSDSCSRLPSDVDRLFGLLFPGILVLVLLPMVIDYFNGCTRARSLGIAAQIKIMGEPSVVFSDHWFNLFGYLLKNTRLCHGRRKSLKTSKICLFLLDFIL